MKRRFKKAVKTQIVKMKNAGFGRLCNCCGMAFDPDGFCGSKHEQGKNYPK